MINGIEMSKCFGCKMCADVCPKNAITFFSNNEGFWYPQVDMGKCVECGLCTQKCPALNETSGNLRDEPQVYAVWSEDVENRITSTSGGVFFEIAKKFITNGGIVVGCAYGDDWKSAYHMFASNMDELERVKGSKYFQSDTAGIFKRVKMEIQKGRNVLFCGTPCQNAALSSFLGEEYENLYYMDFICRSINSPYAFREYISELEDKYQSKVVKVQLKNKQYGWQSLATRVCFENGEEIIRDKSQDWWVKGFVHNDLYTRDSCFNCNYRKIPRVISDITVGDFWGIKNQSDENMFQGISVVLINSKKGQFLLDSNRDSLVINKYNIGEVLPGNPALLKNPIPSGKKEKFFKLLPKKGFSEAVRECSKKSFGQEVFFFMKRIWRMLRRLKWLFRECDMPKFVYYNFFCRQIAREKKSYLIPYKNAVLDIHKDAKIYIKGKNLEIGINKLKKSKAETHLRMRKGAIWKANNGCGMFYNTVLEIHENAIFDSGFFTMNGGSVIIAHKHISFGEDVMIGRNVIIYDSDFHQLRNEYEQPINPPQDVVIEDHVWLTANIEVLKGVTIGKDSLVASYTTVNKNMPEHSIIAGMSSGKVIADYVNWNRDIVPIVETDNK